MHGIAIDVANPAGVITPGQYRSLGIDFVRAEMRINQIYPDLPTALLYGPSTEVNYFWNAVPYNNMVMVIIGNEPDGKGASSWKMTPDEYVELYNRIQPQVPQNVPICAAGMVNGPTFLQACWSRLNRKPNYVNVHYPNYANDITTFALNFSRPVVVGEWCYFTAQTQQQMDEWVAVLNQTTVYSSWFCLSDEMVKNFGVYRHGKLTRAGRFFRNSMHSL